MNAAAPSIRDDLTAAASAGAFRPPMNKAHAVELARGILSPTKAAGPDYPIEGLGPLKHACLAISEGGQVRPAMAGQCLLGAASLLTQGLWNVDSLTGSKPLSLYALTLGDSGDGKSTAQEAALRPVTSWQRDVARRYSDELKEFERAKASRKRGDDPVEIPSLPFRLVGDATVVGLRRDLDTGPCSQGVFSDEAAAILSGYGMSQDHRAKTAGVFSKLWDAGHLSVSRVTGGRVERYGRRLALHWLIQPMAAAESIGDPLLSALGFWPRFLLSWPEAALPRRAQPFRPEELPEVAAYWDRCSELLQMPLPDDAGSCPLITLSADAMRLIGHAFEKFEMQAKSKGGLLQPVKPFALRATEQLCRVAGVQAAFAGRSEVTAADSRNALMLVLHSIETWRLVIEQQATDPTAGNALRLYQWLLNESGECADTSEILKRATPHSLRSKDVRDGAIELLQAHELVVRDGSRVYAVAPLEVRDGKP